MSTAETKMRAMNRHAVIGEENDHVVMVEDVRDPDGRWYKMEYRSRPDGRRAIAFCLFNPWGAQNGGESYAVGHVDANGFLCLGSRHSGQDLEDSPYDIEYVIKRSRFWCTGFSVLKETGEFPHP